MTTLRCRTVSLMLGVLLALGVQTVVGTVNGETWGGGVLWHPAPGSTDLAGERQVPMWAEIRPLPGSTVQVGQIVRFPIRTSRPGYAHLFVRNPGGVFLAVAVNQPVAAGRWQQMRVGRNAAIVARAPAGRTHVALVVTERPLDHAVVPVSPGVDLRSVLAAVPPWSRTVARTHVDVAG